MLRGTVAALGCLAAAAIIVVAIPAPHAAQPVPVSYRGDLTKLAALAPYPAVAPAGLPGSWLPVSSLLTVGGANGAGTVTWHLGLMAPDGLPASWQPVSTVLALGGANGAGTVTWHLGYMTPDGSLASLEETNAVSAAFVRRMTNAGPALPPTRLASQTWSVSATPSRNQRSMYASFAGAAGFTVVVTGNAAWGELRELAASLRPVAG